MDVERVKSGRFDLWPADIDDKHEHAEEAGGPFED